MFLYKDHGTWVPKTCSSMGPAWDVGSGLFCSLPMLVCCENKKYLWKCQLIYCVWFPNAQKIVFMASKIIGHVRPYVMHINLIKWSTYCLFAIQIKHIYDSTCVFVSYILKSHPPHSTSWQFPAPVSACPTPILGSLKQAPLSCQQTLADPGSGAGNLLPAGCLA